MTPKDFKQRVTVDPISGCWTWARYLNSRGYGQMTHNGKRGQMAHRVSYELFVGPIPDDMTVDHQCFNPACVNPDHLQLLSHADNSRQQRSALKTHCIKGHEFTPENTYLKPGFRNGRRTCRTCQRDAVRKYQERKAA